MALTRARATTKKIMAFISDSGNIERVESGNLTACIADAEKIATAAESIIKNPSDI